MFRRDDAKLASKLDEMTARKIYQRLLHHTQNVRFSDLCKVVVAFGYKLDRTKGSHHIYEHPQAPRPLSLQDCRGQAKPYQIRQLLRDVEEFQLTLND
jgi:predicted RNA binding protein YcfA (HicA-like mRNA interferase family)